MKAVINPPWTSMEPVRLGQLPGGLGTADQFVTLEDELEPLLRVDLYCVDDECYAFEKPLIWQDFLVIGWGHHLYILEFNGHQVLTIALDSYFASLYPFEDFLLVSSAENLNCIERNGTLRWQSCRLGIDGVIIDRVEDGIIHGQGEWNPPNGWRYFRLNLKTGENV